MSDELSGAHLSEVPEGSAEAKGQRPTRLSRLSLEGARELLVPAAVPGVFSAFVVIGPAIWSSVSGHIPDRIGWLVVAVVCTAISTVAWGACIYRSFRGVAPSRSEIIGFAPKLLGIPLVTAALVLVVDVLVGLLSNGGGDTPLPVSEEVLIGVVGILIGSLWLAFVTTWAARVVTAGTGPRTRGFRGTFSILVSDRKSFRRLLSQFFILAIMAVVAAVVVALYLTAFVAFPPVQAWFEWLTVAALSTAWIASYLSVWNAFIGQHLSADPAPTTASHPGLRHTPGIVVAAIVVVVVVAGLGWWGSRTSGSALADTEASVDTSRAVQLAGSDNAAAIAAARQATAEAAAAEAFQLAQVGNSTDALTLSTAALSADPSSVEAHLVDGILNAQLGNVSAAEIDAVALGHLGAGAASQEVLSYLPTVSEGGKTAAVLASLDDPFAVYSAYPLLKSLVSGSGSSTVAPPSSSAGSDGVGAVADDPTLDNAVSAWVQAASAPFPVDSSSADLSQAGLSLADTEQVFSVIAPGASSGGAVTEILPGLSPSVAYELAQSMLVSSTATGGSTGATDASSLLSLPDTHIDSISADELFSALDAFNEIDVEIGGGGYAPPLQGITAVTDGLALAKKSSSLETLKVDAGVYELLSSQYATAAKLFAAAAKQDPSDETARTYEGYADYELADFVKAIAVMPTGGGEAASTLNLSLLGQSYLGASQNTTDPTTAILDAQTSIQDLNAALKLDPSPWLTWLGLGDAYIAAQEPAQAITAFESGEFYATFDTKVSFPTFSAPREGYGFTGGVNEAGTPDSFLESGISTAKAAEAATTTTTVASQGGSVVP